MTECRTAWEDFCKGKISQEELDRRMQALMRKQLVLWDDGTAEWDGFRFKKEEDHGTSRDAETNGN